MVISNSFTPKVNQQLTDFESELNIIQASEIQTIDPTNSNQQDIGDNLQADEVFTGAEAEAGQSQLSALSQGNLYLFLFNFLIIL